MTQNLPGRPVIFVMSAEEAKALLIIFFEVFGGFTEREKPLDGSRLASCRAGGRPIAVMPCASESLHHSTASPKPALNHLHQTCITCIKPASPASNLNHLHHTCITPRDPGCVPPSAPGGCFSIAIFLHVACFL